jgi:RNA polymerase-binding transcription factor DksA
MATKSKQPTEAATVTETKVTKSKKTATAQVAEKPSVADSSLVEDTTNTSENKDVSPIAAKKTSSKKSKINTAEPTEAIVAVADIVPAVTEIVVEHENIGEPLESIHLAEFETVAIVDVAMEEPAAAAIVEAAPIPEKKSKSTAKDKKTVAEKTVVDANPTTVVAEPEAPKAKKEKTSAKATTVAAPVAEKLAVEPVAQQSSTEPVAEVIPEIVAVPEPEVRTEIKEKTKEQKHSSKKEAAEKKAHDKKTVVKEIPKPLPIKPIPTATRPTPTIPRPLDRKPIVIAHRKLDTVANQPKSNEGVLMNYQPEAYRSILDTPEPVSTPNYRYSDEDLAEFKEIIINRLEKARKELGYLQGLITRRDEEGTDDTENRFMNMEDGSGAMEREQISQLASRQIQFINNLEKAMVRIENKTYGICRETGKLIDKNRLRKVPHATLSIEAKNARGTKK